METVKLTDLKQGQNCKIVAINCNKNLVKNRLLTLGFVCNTNLCMAKKSLKHLTVLIGIRGTFMSMQQNLASCIIVKIIN
ncbi:MAG: FeoA family protein [Clostridia bacterium]